MAALEMKMSGLSVGNGARGGGNDAAGQGIKKQRSQRFTVSTSNTNLRSTAKSHAAAPPVPSLPFQDSPLPVESQTISHTPVDPHFPQTEQKPSPFAPEFAPKPHEFQYQYAPPPNYATSFGQRQAGEVLGRPYMPQEWGRAGLGMAIPSFEYGGAASGGYPMMNAGAQFAEEDEVIPTAIVIKNIPFHVPKDSLLAIIDELQLPPPFAFNYHFDNGQFRGLAFANFRHDQEAVLVVTALNGFDLQGRKLRVEFKKVLKEGEKERIERDKALKRIRSQQLLSSPPSAPPAFLGPQGPPLVWNRREASAPGAFGTSSMVGDDEDYGQVVAGPYSSLGLGGGAKMMGSLAGRDYAASFGGGGGTSVARGQEPFLLRPGGGAAKHQSEASLSSSSPPSDVGTSISARIERVDATTTSSNDSRYELDLNDPQALEIYSRVLLFKDDSLRDELAFARSLSAAQRRNVHLVAKKLGLEHASVGDGEDRHVVVYKGGKKPPVVSDKSRRSNNTASLGRHAASAFLATPSSSVRSKKSMPDFRGSTSYTSAYLSPSTTGSTPSRDVPSLQGLFRASPPVPSIPSQHQPGGGGTSAASAHSLSPRIAPGALGGEPLRQPRGPESLEQRGFRKGENEA